MCCGMHYAISSILGERILFGIMRIIHGVWHGQIRGNHQSAKEVSEF